jgi:hypothetical protein
MNRETLTRTGSDGGSERASGWSGASNEEVSRRAVSIHLYCRETTYAATAASARYSLD